MPSSLRSQQAGFPQNWSKQHERMKFIRAIASIALGTEGVEPPNLGILASEPLLVRVFSGCAAMLAFVVGALRSSM